MLLVLISISLVSLCVGEDYQAWYIPADKLARYPDHPKFKTNEDIFYGFTLKEPLFSAEEREEVCKRGCVCLGVGEGGGEDNVVLEKELEKREITLTIYLVFKYLI